MASVIVAADLIDFLIVITETYRYNAFTTLEIKTITDSELP